MKRVRFLFILIPALAAGTFYAWLHEPKALYTFGMHLYLVLGILSLLSSFISGLLIHIEPEKNLLTTTLGIVAAIFANSFIFGIPLLHSYANEFFILLFFAGHASLFGTYGAVFAKSFSLPFKTPAKVQRRTHYSRYSVAE